MRRLLVIFILLAVSLSFAEGWKKTGDFSLLLSQTYYSDNWDGSEMGNVNWTASFNFIMEKQLSEKFHDKNTLLLSFGQTHYQARDEMNELYWEKPQITTDLIDYENMLTLTLKKLVDPFASFRWESRFYDSTDPEDTYYINPNTLTLSVGGKRVFINQEIQSLESSVGAAWKNYLNQNSNIDNSNNAGAELVVSYWRLFRDDLGKLDSKLRVYQALMTSEDNGNDNWKSPDVEFLNTVTFKLSSYVGLKFYLELLYDKEIDDEFRLKENLGLNLSYALFK